MTTTPDVRRWDALVAARTRGDVGDGIASVLAFLGVPDVISFAGGFPDPETFPRERVSTLVQELAASGEATAFQYAPTRGVPGRSRQDPARKLLRRNVRHGIGGATNLERPDWLEIFELEPDLGAAIRGH